MTLILGAGISGLTAGKFLKHSFKIIEKTRVAGGLSTQYRSGDFLFDYGGHYFHFKDKSKIKTYVEKFSSFKEYSRDSRISLFNKFIPFPVQFHLSYFPKKISEQVLEEILNRDEKKTGDLKDFLLNNFGQTLCGYFFFPFLSKYYRRNLSEIIPLKDKGSIPVPKNSDVIAGYRGKRFKDTGYNPLFYYPEKSLKNFMDNYEKSVKDNILFSEEVKRIDVDNRKVFTEKGVFDFNNLINTLPLKQFVSMIDGWEKRFPEAADLEHISTAVVNVVLKRRRKRFHWLYIPQAEIPFYRAGYYPGGKHPVCYLEMSLKPGKTPDMNTISSEANKTLVELGLIKNRDEVIYMDIKIIPVSYIIFNRSWENDVSSLIEKLRDFNIETTGRFGKWDYSSMSDDILSAKEITEKINE